MATLRSYQVLSGTLLTACLGTMHSHEDNWAPAWLPAQLQSTVRSTAPVVCQLQLLVPHLYSRSCVLTLASCSSFRGLSTSPSPPPA